MTDVTWPFPSDRKKREERLIAQTERVLQEHIELAVMVQRLSFLLNSARLVIGDQVARDIAGDAVSEAGALLAKVRKQ